MSNLYFILIVLFGTFALYLAACALVKLTKLAIIWIFTFFYRPVWMAIAAGIFFVWIIILVVNAVPL